MACRLLLAAVLALAGVEVVFGARILAFLPVPAKSHQAMFTPVLRALAERGHHVSAYVPFKMADPPPNYKEVILPNVLEDFIGSMDIKAMRKINPIFFMLMFFGMGITMQNNICNLEPVKELIRSDEQFDVVILESFFNQELFSGLQHKFGALGVDMIPAGGHIWMYDLIGNPYNPSYMPDIFLTYSDSMTFTERLLNAVSSFTYLLLSHVYYLPRIEALSRSCLDYAGSEDRPYLGHMMVNKSLILENSHYSLNYPIALAPHVINVAGLNLHPNKPLPKDIQQFMDEANEGVIYFSLGSNINVSAVVQDEIFTSFISAFGKLKQRVLWKWEKDEFANRPANVKISKWFPQQDILAHPNMKLFITHGGFLSMTEAVSNGVPLIGIPFMADQPKNIKYGSIHGFTLPLEYDNITEHSILWAVNEVLSNPSYTQNARERSRIFRDKPMSPLQSSIYWIEYVIRHKGAAHLRPKLGQLPWYKSMLLDVVLFLFSIALLITYVTYFCCKKLLPLCTASRKPNSQAKTKTQKLKRH